MLNDGQIASQQTEEQTARFPIQLSVEEIDLLIGKLDRAMDVMPVSENRSGDKCILNLKQESKLFIDFPLDAWNQVVEKCKENQLDPDHMVTEAMLTYYRELLMIYRSRLMVNATNPSGLR